MFSGTASSEDESKGARKKQKKGGSTTVAAATSVAGSGSQGESIDGPADVLDMPVDPNEPTYCTCNQVSYGEMIGCDNPDVSILTCFS